MSPAGAGPICRFRSWRGGSGIACSLRNRSRVVNQRKEKFSRLFGHRHMPGMLEPHEVFFGCFHRLEPGSGELGTHIHVVATFEQDQGNFEVADLGEIGRDQIRKQKGGANLLPSHIWLISWSL